MPVPRLGALAHSPTLRFTLPVMLENTLTIFIGLVFSRIISTISGSALAAIGSVLYFIPRSSVYPLAGSLPGLKCFVAAVFGGIGSIPGALVGGFLIGLCETFIKGSAYSEFSDVFTFVVLILVLLVRPTGLFGEKLKEKV